MSQSCFKIISSM